MRDIRVFNLASLRKNFIKLCLSSYVVITLVLIVILLSIPNKYKSVGIYAPAEHLQGDGLSGLAGSLGGLAGLAGLNLNTSKRDSLQIALEIAKSKKFLFNLIESEDIKVKVFAAKKWDKETDTLTYNEKVYNAQTNTWVRDEPNPEPTTFEVYKVLKDNLTINFDEKNTLVKISYVHVSPHFSYRLVNKIEKKLNSVLKERNINDAKISIELLENSATTTSNIDLKGLLYELVEEQTKKLLLAQSRQYYILEPIDPPIVPEEKSTPKRGLLLISFTFVYFLISALILVYFRSHEKK